jgi:methylmalonyl-CoA mutase
MNAISAGPDGSPVVYMRSVAMHESSGDLPRSIPGMLAACRAAGFDLIIIETVGIGQHDSSIAQLADVSLYVMTSEFGAATQLEKIDMLDFADAVAINKFDRRGAADALRDVRKQVQRNRNAFGHRLEEMPVYGTVASRFSDDGVTALYHHLREKLREKGLVLRESQLPKPPDKIPSRADQFVPASRERYLADVAQTVRAYKRHARDQGQLARELQHLSESARILTELGQPTLSTVASLETEIAKRRSRMDPRSARPEDPRSPVSRHSLRHCHSSSCTSPPA